MRMACAGTPSMAREVAPPMRKECRPTLSDGMLTLYSCRADFSHESMEQYVIGSPPAV